MEEIRVGRISSLNCPEGKVRVTYADRDQSVTKEVPLLSSEYFMPAVGDLVLVLHLSNGAESAVVLGGYWNKDRVPPEQGEKIYRKDFGHAAGACYLKYDENAKKLTIYSDGAVDLTIPGKLAIVAGEVSITAPAVSITADTGDVKINGISLINHKHAVAGDKTGIPLGEEAAP